MLLVYGMLVTLCVVGVAITVISTTSAGGRGERFLIANPLDCVDHAGIARGRHHAAADPFDQVGRIAIRMGRVDRVRQSRPDRLGSAQGGDRTSRATARRPPRIMPYVGHGYSGVETVRSLTAVAAAASMGLARSPVQDILGHHERSGIRRIGGSLRTSQRRDGNAASDVSRYSRLK